MSARPEVPLIVPWRSTGGSFCAPPPLVGRPEGKTVNEFGGVYGDNNYTYLHTWKKNGVLDCREVTEQEQKHS